MTQPEPQPQPQAQVESSFPLRLSGREDIVFSKTLLVTAILYITGFSYSTFFPSSENWGFHSLAFMPQVIQVTILLLMVALLFPKVQSLFLNTIESIVSGFPNLSRSQNIVLGVTGAMVAGLFFWFGREHYYFLGDGYILTKKIVSMNGIERIPEFSPNEPLVGLVLYYTYRLLELLGFGKQGDLPYQIISVFSGIGFTICSILLASAVSKNRTHKTLIVLFMIATGVSQLFFGYVEMYALSGFLFSLFLLLAALYLRERISIVFPSIVFALLIVSHIAMASLLPVIVLLIMYSKRRKFLNFLIVSATVSGILFLVFVLSKFDWQSFSLAFLSGGSHLLPLQGSITNEQPYSLVSAVHWAELFQLYILLCPFALILVFSTFFIFRKTIEWGDPILQFFVLVSLCGLGTTLLLNPELGLSRDWDAFSPLYIGLIAMAGIIPVCYIPSNTKIRKSLVMILGITILHVLTWISLNASDDESLARLHALPSTTTWSRKATLYAYEDFAIMYRKRIDGPQSIEWYKKYLSIDSMNPRIWGSMGHVYQLIGDEENKMEAYEKARRCGSVDVNLLADLGMMQLKHGNTEDAISAFQQLLTIDSTQPDAHFYIGIAYFSQNKSAKALEYFERTIALSPSYLKAYFAGIEIYIRNNNILRAREMFGRYLRYAPPNSPQTDSLRKRLGY